MRRSAAHAALAVDAPDEEDAHSYEPQLEEQREVLRGRSWSDYEALLAERGEGAVPRITFLDGVIELMAPGIYHEVDKKKLARIVEAWAEATGQFLDGLGSWTLKSKRFGRGAEPDECYVLTERARSRIKRPDFAIEVVRTSGGLSKLEVYRKFRVPEVWFWKDARLRFFALRRDGYREIPRSELLPALDPALIERVMREPSQPAAVRKLRAALGSK